MPFNKKGEGGKEKASVLEGEIARQEITRLHWGGLREGWAASAKSQARRGAVMLKGAQGQSWDGFIVAAEQRNRYRGS